jgi:hypothetical protein
VENFAERREVTGVDQTLDFRFQDLPDHVAFLALALAQSNASPRLLQNVTKDGRFEVTLVFSSWHLRGNVPK